MKRLKYSGAIYQNSNRFNIIELAGVLEGTETKQDENEKIKKWLDNYRNAGGFPVTLNLPLETFEKIGQYMEGRPFKSFGETIVFLLNSHPETIVRMRTEEQDTGKPESYEMAHS